MVAELAQLAGPIVGTARKKMASSSKALWLEIQGTTQNFVRFFLPCLGLMSFLRYVFVCFSCIKVTGSLNSKSHFNCSKYFSPPSEIPSPERLKLERMWVYCGGSLTQPGSLLGGSYLYPITLKVLPKSIWLDFWLEWTYYCVENCPYSKAK